MQVFLSLAKGGSSTGPMGLQDTEVLGGLLDGRYIYRCTSPMMNSNRREDKRLGKQKEMKE